MRASPHTIVGNYVAAMAIIGLAWAYYQFNPYYASFFSSTHTWPWFSVTDQQLWTGAIIAFAVLLPPYYASLKDSHITKSRHVWNAVLHLGRRGPTQDEKVALLATIVKAFFLPLMVAWFFANGAEFFRHADRFMDNRQFFASGYWVLFNLLIFIDVAWFTLAYSIEHPRLNNEIKSVEPTLLGWFVALICYPPFNGVTNEMLGWYSSDYPGYTNIWIKYGAAVLMLGLMTIYVWATVALNVKASNLTNRGIVTGGPYAYIRHPAYVCKNLTWIIGSIPVLAVQYQKDGTGQLLFAAFCVFAWCFVYYLRAVTEEKHLMADPDYVAYAKTVPGFIPRGIALMFQRRKSV